MLRTLLTAVRGPAVCVGRCFSSEVSGAVSTLTGFSSPPFSTEASLYVHWPYCLKRCSYCNFNKYIPRSDNQDVMLECLQRETETLLKLSQVSRGRDSRSSLALHYRWLVLETLLSLRDDDLKVLGRDHNSQHALQTVAEARRLCPGRVSVDVMFGRPGQSVASWELELDELLSVCDDHVSLYQLTLERGTQLFRQVQKGQLSVPSDDITAVMYDSARRILQKRGYLQYEVSNFARNGAISQHNMSYWKASQYLGVGPGAHGRFVPRGEGDVCREARTQTLEPDVWLREVQQRSHGTRRRIPLTHLGLLEEVLVMGLRLIDGITHQHWQLFSPRADLYQILSSSSEVQDLQQTGLLILDDRGLRCSWQGLALLDSMLPTLLLLLEAYITQGLDNNSGSLQL
ncbi:radical S-adenosyl methionine domain-containing protein 1, mitochondrial-like [Oncorhynchus keta]|uniref:radical S-adenosyl methionine domain-containing protein 1, mitochondrial-like n=1 Tax=Oncorhynchus keta TaxID=8018 RepID=UPI00227D4B97|nr:radical S-adenosyl methionine domain-containing protein 1, mitochondrial-like [Oncorhynchus keta]